MLQLSQFVWTLRSSVKVVYNNFLLIDATDRNKISSDQKRLFFAVIAYTPFHFLRTLPLKCKVSFPLETYRGSEVKHLIKKVLIIIEFFTPNSSYPFYRRR